MPAVETGPSTSSSDIARILEAQRQNAPRIRATTADERIEKLRRLERTVLRRKDEIRRAMWEDFRKPVPEVDLSEIFLMAGEARHAQRHLRKWMRPKRVPGRLALFGASSYVVYQPKGVVLIISPWNFPFNLSIGPLIGAVAAGNCAIIKPSELTPASSACMKRLLADVFDESEVAVIEGEVEVSQALLRERFDHIFFTGSPNVGKIVMKAAAEHLTSVTLELGGKSPVVVDKSADLDMAARRLAWAKQINCGQACVAPDYVVVDEAIRDQFVEKLRRQMARFVASRESCLVISDRHAKRLRRLLDEAKSAGAEVLFAEPQTDDVRSMTLTLVGGVDDSVGLMQEEIFGPILPMVTYKTTEEAIDIIGRREHPLVLYIFSRDRRFINEVVGRTSAGGTSINHLLMHFFQHNLPFGGVGVSGMGKGHGFAGFEAFSNARGVFDQKTSLTPIEFLFPPYNAIKQKMIDLTVRFF